MYCVYVKIMYVYYAPGSSKELQRCNYWLNLQWIMGGSCNGKQSFYTNYKTLENSCCVLCPWKQRWSAQYRYENFVRERACYIAYYVSVTNFHRIITRCIPPNISPLTFPTVAHNITFYEMIRALLILHKESFGSMIEKNIASRVTIGDHLMRTTVLSIIHV